MNYIGKKCVHGNMNYLIGSYGWKFGEIVRHRLRTIKNRRERKSILKRGDKE